MVSEVVREIGTEGVNAGKGLVSKYMRLRRWTRCNKATASRRKKCPKETLKVKGRLCNGEREKREEVHGAACLLQFFVGAKID